MKQKKAKLLANQAQVVQLIEEVHYDEKRRHHNPDVPDMWGYLDNIYFYLTGRGLSDLGPQLDCNGKPIPLPVPPTPTKPDLFKLSFECTVCGSYWQIDSEYACNDRCPCCRTENEPCCVLDL